MSFFDLIIMYTDAVITQRLTPAPVRAIISRLLSAAIFCPNCENIAVSSDSIETRAAEREMILVIITAGLCC